MKDKILQVLSDLRNYALEKGVEATFFYHEEDSYLMRFANSAISLNTNEHLVRLEITTHDGKKRATYEVITDLSKIDEMKAGVDIAAEMMTHTQPLTYQPTIPLYTELFADESGYDEELALLSNEDRLAYFNKAVEGLETDEIQLSGIFSCGANTIALINTRSEYAQYFKTSDAQINVVLSHPVLKWEVIANQSAQRKSDLNPSSIHKELAFLLNCYLTITPEQLSLGEYDIVFGSDTTADLLSMLNWIGFSGGSMKRGFSFIKEEQIGQKVLSEKFNLTDDPGNMATFPFKQDLMGMPRKAFPLFEKGVFKAFTWFQDEADEFDAQPTGHTVMHKSLVMGSGEKDVNSLEELVNMPREKDILYIPYLHYMNIVNPSTGLITGTSRFGALLLKKDGTIGVPFNVRVTQSYDDIFGDNLEWLSKQTAVVNTSMSYGARNPTAIIAPKFFCVKDLEISHSNSTF